MTKFFEVFLEKSNGAYPELKFNSATYIRKNNELEIRFIISAFDAELFNEGKMDAVKATVEEMFQGVNVTITYIRTYADNANVLGKIYEYFNKYEHMFFSFLSEKGVTITIEEKDIDIKIVFDTPTYRLLKNSDFETKIKEYLDENFNGNISVKLIENVIDINNIKIEDIKPAPAPKSSKACRLITTTGCDKVYARGKVSGVSQMPSYISDIKQPVENVVLCGKISGIQHKEYKNKKYNPDDPKSKEPEMKPMFRCMLNDTTANIECVCFPRQTDVEMLKSLNEEEQIICLGNVTISTYNGQLSYALDGIFRCSIDFNSIQQSQNKNCPEQYTTVFPEPYMKVSQESMFDEKVAVPEFVKGKTFVIFDFEATDKYINTAEPIELAAVKMVDGVLTEVFQSFAKPNEPISEFITNLTSITNEMVADSPKFEDILPDFFKFTRGCTLVGHNISGYDFPLLEKYARQEGYKFDNELVDTLLLAREHLTEFKRFDLVNLSKNLNISHENAHRAIADVYATAELLKIIATRL